MGHLAKGLHILPVHSSQLEQEGIYLYRHWHWMHMLSFIVTGKRVTHPANISTLHLFSTPMLVYYPPKMQHYQFATCPTPLHLHPQEKIHLPSMHRNWLWTGHGWWTRKQPLHSSISPHLVPFPLTQSILAGSWACVGWAYICLTNQGWKSACGPLVIDTQVTHIIVKYYQWVIITSYSIRKNPFTKSVT